MSEINEFAPQSKVCNEVEQVLKSRLFYRILEKALITFGYKEQLEDGFIAKLRNILNGKSFDIDTYIFIKSTLAQNINLLEYIEKLLNKIRFVANSEEREKLMTELFYHQPDISSEFSEKTLITERFKRQTLHRLYDGIYINSQDQKETIAPKKNDEDMLMAEWRTMAGGNENTSQDKIDGEINLEFGVKPSERSKGYLFIGNILNYLIDKLDALYVENYFRNEIYDTIRDVEILDEGDNFMVIELGEKVFIFDKRSNKIVKNICSTKFKQFEIKGESFVVVCDIEKKFEIGYFSLDRGLIGQLGTELSVIHRLGKGKYLFLNKNTDGEFIYTTFSKTNISNSVGYKYVSSIIDFGDRKLGYLFVDKNGDQGIQFIGGEIINFGKKYIGNMISFLDNKYKKEQPKPLGGYKLTKEEPSMEDILNSIRRILNEEECEYSKGVLTDGTIKKLEISDIAITTIDGDSIIVIEESNEGNFTYQLYSLSKNKKVSKKFLGTPKIIYDKEEKKITIKGKGVKGGNISISLKLK